jgi:hypothetical protein
MKMTNWITSWTDEIISTETGVPMTNLATQLRLCVRCINRELVKTDRVISL